MPHFRLMYNTQTLPFLSSLMSLFLFCLSPATSTVGLFYPSATSIQSQFELEAQERSLLEASRDRRPALAAVSPGKGFWRQQMDHVCSHIRAHAQNNPDFRSTIGEPRLGKIITATVHEAVSYTHLTLPTKRIV